MPIIKSAKKQLKQSLKNKARNEHFKALYAESRKAFEKAIKEKDATKAREILVNKKDSTGKNIKSGLQAIIDKLEKKNIIHKNNASRKKSKYFAILKALEKSNSI